MSSQRGSLVASGQGTQHPVPKKKTENFRQPQDIRIPEPAHTQPTSGSSCEGLGGEQRHCHTDLPRKSCDVHFLTRACQCESQPSGQILLRTIGLAPSSRCPEGPLGDSRGSHRGVVITRILALLRCSCHPGSCPTASSAAGPAYSQPELSGITWPL